MDRKRPTLGLILLMLPALVWLFYNTTVNRHVHVLADGTVILQSHPFEKKSSSSDPLNAHHHSEKELMLLSLFSDSLISVITFLILRPFLGACFQFIVADPNHGAPARKYFQVHHYHAPPFSC
jgi:4-amino-4-deoxy-L-arabinose transferase-like glycosyltransferase